MTVNMSMDSGQVGERGEVINPEKVHEVWFREVIDHTDDSYSRASKFADCTSDH